MWISRPFKKDPGATKAASAASGIRAEREAEVYLLEQGLRLEQRNYRCKLGEIDLIMLHDQAYVFVEVRYRKQLRYGSPAETVDYFKQSKLRRTAQYFLQSKGLIDKVPCRFDVVSVAGQSTTSRAAVEWIENAF